MSKEESKQILSMRPEEGLALWYEFLLNEIMLARSPLEQPFYLMSPWINNFSLDLSKHRGVPELGIKPGKFTLASFCRAYVENGGNLRILVHFPLQSHKRGKPVWDTIEFLSGLYNHPSGRVEIRLHQRLHAKIYVGLGAVLSGSANATSGGLHYNSENLYYFSSEEEIKNHREKVKRLWKDKEMLVSWDYAKQLWRKGGGVE